MSTRAASTRKSTCARSSSSVDGTWALLLDSAATTSCASWFTTLSLIRVSPTTAAAPASSGSHAATGAPARPRPRDRQRGTSGHCAPSRDTCLTSAVPSGWIASTTARHQASSSVSRSGWPPTRAVRRARHEHGTCRRLDDRPRVQPLEPQRRRLGQLHRGEPHVRALQRHLGDPGLPGQHPERGHREQVLHRRRQRAVAVDQLLADRVDRGVVGRPRRAAGRPPAAAARPGCSRAAGARRPAGRP